MTWQRLLQETEGSRRVYSPAGLHFAGGVVSEEGPDQILCWRRRRELFLDWPLCPSPTLLPDQSPQSAFIHSLIPCVPCAYYVPGTVTSTEQSAIRQNADLINFCHCFHT